MGDNKQIAINTAQNIIKDQIVGAAKDKIIKETMSDAIKNEAVKDAGASTFKSAFGYASLFIGFVDTYSKAVKAANLENVRRNLEVCPHIGGCENYGHAIKIASDTTATVWRAADGYWYFHPQINYRVRHPQQILRSTSSGGWKMEQLGKSEWNLQDCLGCVEAHCGN